MTYPDIPLQAITASRMDELHGKSWANLCSVTFYVNTIFFPLKPRLLPNLVDHKDDAAQVQESRAESSLDLLQISLVDEFTMPGTAYHESLQQGHHQAQRSRREPGMSSQSSQMTKVHVDHFPRPCSTRLMELRRIVTSIKPWLASEVFGALL